MAKAKTYETLVDHVLGVAEAEWRRLPEAEAGFDSWDPDERAVFVFEWSLAESRLHRLREWDAEGIMTVGQANRYEDLKRLVAENRIIIARLRA
jgi:hypothetical protein